MRAYNALRRSGIVTLGAVISKQPEELLAIRKFGGVKSLEDVREGVDEALKSGLWRSYRDYGLISEWIEAAELVCRRSQT
jgi:DNA-directed RNA polymerase alpha subunit